MKYITITMMLLLLLTVIAGTPMEDHRLETVHFPDKEPLKFRLAVDYKYQLHGNSKITIDGENAAIHLDYSQLMEEINDGGITRRISTLEVVNAPNSEIVAQDFDNTNLTLIDSPNSIIRDNSFHDFIVDQSNYSIIQLIRSGGSTIEGNLINTIQLLEQVEVFNMVDVVDSDEIFLSGNQISEVYSEPLVKPARVKGLSFSGGTSITLETNEFTTWTIESTSLLDFSLISIRDYSQLTLYGSYLDSISILSQNDLRFRYISVNSTNQPGSLLYEIADNHLSNAEINSEAGRVHYTGIELNMNSQLQNTSVNLEQNSQGNVIASSGLSTDDGVSSNSNLEGITVTASIGNSSVFIQGNDFDTISAVTAAEVPGNFTAISVVGLNNSYIRYGTSTGLPEYDQLRAVGSYNTTVVFELGTEFVPVMYPPSAAFEYFEVRDSSTTLDSGPIDHIAGIRWNIPIKLGTTVYDIAYVDEQSATIIDDSLSILQVDTTLPAISGPSIQEFELNNSTRIASWTVTDLTLSNVALLLNGTLLFEDGVQDSSYILSYDVSHLQAGTYMFQIRSYDTSNNLRSVYRYVTIHDSQSPVIQELGNLIVSYNGTTELTWDVFDYNPGTYELYINTTLWKSGNWTNDQPISHLFSNKALGSYMVLLRVFDETGLESNQSVVIEVIDDIAPVVLSTVSQVTELGGETIVSWHLDDLQPWYYNISVNGILVENMTDWVTGNVTYTFIAEYPDVHNITITVIDHSGNVAEHTSVVIVEDTVAPEIVGTDLVSVIEGGTATISWLIIDFDPDFYLVFAQHAVLVNGTWSNGDTISVQVQLPPPGYYNYTILTMDGSGNVANHTTILEVRPVYSHAGPGDDDTSPTGPTLDIDPRYIAGAGAFLIVIAGVSFLTRRK